MEKIATDISTFENLRKGGYVYVDKTDMLWRLVANQVGRQFFIARPRRFGKSLMLSTLRCIFEARVSSPRALLRLARFQAESCETNMRTFVRNVRAALKRPALSEAEVPAGLMMDVVLPRFKR